MSDRWCQEQDDCTTMVFRRRSRSAEVVAHDYSSSGALGVSPPEESNRTAQCRTATPGI